MFRNDGCCCCCSFWIRINAHHITSTHTHTWNSRPFLTLTLVVFSASIVCQSFLWVVCRFKDRVGQFLASHTTKWANDTKSAGLHFQVGTFVVDFNACLCVSLWLASHFVACIVIFKWFVLSTYTHINNKRTRVGMSSTNNSFCLDALHLTN